MARKPGSPRKRETVRPDAIEAGRNALEPGSGKRESARRGPARRGSVRRGPARRNSARRVGNRSATLDPRQLWAVNVVPLLTAAREGAAQAARTASRERARARRQPWWRRRWVIVTGAGLVAAGTAGGVYAVLTKGRATAGSGAGADAEPGPGPAGTSPTGGLKSTMETGREKVTGAARTVLHKIRGNHVTEARPGALTTARPDQSRNDVPTTGTGYNRPG